MLRPQKGNSGVSFNDTLLNFGLWVYYKTVYCTTVQCAGCPIKIKDYKQHTDSSFNIVFVQAIQNEYKTV